MTKFVIAVNIINDFHSELTDHPPCLTHVSPSVTFFVTRQLTFPVTTLSQMMSSCIQ